MSASASAISVNNPFAQFISQVDAISIDDLVGEARLGPAQNFRDARSTFQSIKDFVEQLRFLDVTEMPGRIFANASTRFQELLNSIQNIRSYNPDNYGGNPASRSNLVQQLKSNYETFVEVAIPVLLYSSFRSSAIVTVQADTHAALADIERQRAELVRKVNESEELLSKQKKFSEEIAIAGYGNLFAKEAKAHEDSAKTWLWITGGLAAVTLIAAVANYIAALRLQNSAIPQFPTSLALQLTIAKVILFTIGLSAAYWSARVYRSHRHNSIVNKHRANALTSFQEFVVAATDPEVKNAVLLQTTSCIYAPQATGFSSGNDTDGDSSLKVLEIIRNFQK